MNNKKIITFDFETTPISEGTPEVLYLTAFGENFKLSMPITGKSENKFKIICDILEQYFLVPENNGCQFIGWNSNKYDNYFIGRALLESDKWIIQPYMTASKALRGFRVKEKLSEEQRSKKKRILQFEFLDGMAMTGVSVPLGDKQIYMEDGTVKIKKGFLSTFSPEYQKLQSPNFKLGECFDVNNPEHIKYAERDSEGLYHAMKKVESIIKDLTGLPLKPTIGNLAIHHFMNNVPDGVILKRPTDKLLSILHGDLKRGGYCWAMRQYKGPVWKYDINQAYAAAMRDCNLPAGDTSFVKSYVSGLPGVYDCTLSRDKPCKVPFYYKQDKQGLFSVGRKPVRTYITSVEVEHLIKDGWNVNVHGGYVWNDSFTMKDFVDKLEKLRSTDKDGPSGPLGLMVKALGNNAYGKTLEQVWGQEFVFAKSCPEGYDLYDSFDPNASYIFSRDRKSFPKKYHLPQIGVFITSHVRCVVREAAIKEQDYFLYADTDCVMFSKPVKHLDVDKTRYGAWKQESDGDDIIIISKKVYHSKDGSKAKGLVVEHLKIDDYEKWLKGYLPTQDQVQRQNIIGFLRGDNMFRTLTRKGTNVKLSKTAECVDGIFVPC